MRTVVRRHGYVLWRSPHRWFDIVVWPLFDVLLWGSLGAFVAQENDASRAGTPYLLAGIMLFHVLFQSQIAVSTGFMEETWTRNLLNMMTTPLREIEYVVGLAVYGLAKLAAAMAMVRLTALAFYGFGLGEVGWGLVPIVGVLLVDRLGAGHARDRPAAPLRPERRDPRVGEHVPDPVAVGCVQPGRAPSPGRCSRSPGSCPPPTSSAPRATCSTASRCRGATSGGAPRSAPCRSSTASHWRWSSAASSTHVPQRAATSPGTRYQRWTRRPMSSWPGTSVQTAVAGSV